MAFPTIIIGYLIILSILLLLQLIGLIHCFHQVYHYLKKRDGVKCHTKIPPKVDSKELPLIEFHDYVNL